MPRKWNINDKLRRKFSGAGWCECGCDTFSWDCEANHCPPRSLGGAHRIDSRLTLCRLTPACHRDYHRHKITRQQLEARIAYREKCQADDLRAAVAFLESLPWCPLAARCAADRGLGGLSEAVSVLVARTLQEAKV